MQKSLFETSDKADALYNGWEMGSEWYGQLLFVSEWNHLGGSRGLSFLAFLTEGRNDYSKAVPGKEDTLKMSNNIQRSSGPYMDGDKRVYNETFCLFISLNK